MPRPKFGYFLADGKTRVPSVTTVIARFKESGGLIHWAWDQGRQDQNYREVRDAAASAGTLAHALVESHIRRVEFPDRQDFPSAIWDKAIQGFENFLTWSRMCALTPVETEVSLVSEQHRFGGTLDAIAIQNELTLADWKTSNRVYPEYLIQLAAYAGLWAENRPGKPTKGFHLLRFDKDHADFTHHYFSELDDAWRAFLLMRELYDLDKKLKERL